MTYASYNTTHDRQVNGALDMLREEASSALDMIELLNRWYRLTMAGQNFDGGECPFDEAQHEVRSFGLEEMSIRSTRLYGMVANLQVAQ